MASKKGKKNTPQAAKASSVPSGSSATAFWSAKWHMIIIFALGCILYVNTLGHEYAQDDAIVIYDNMFTQDGLSGIPGILKYDTFYGFFKEAGKAKLVSGGRYRPFTLVMFAVEWQLFGRQPFIGHFMNILLYALLGIMIYKCLILLFSVKSDDKKMLAFALISSLLYIAHPIHTEAVANIKGRDEIMTMLGSVFALWALFKYDRKAEKKWLISSLGGFFIALMSKENAITFLAIAPASFMLFRGKSLVSSLKKSWPLFASAILFLIIRFSVLGMDFGGTPNELMNNPFLKLANNSYIPFTPSEKYATIFFTLGKYMQLMFFPHPLCHDYYPRAIEIMSFGNWQVWLSVLLYLLMTLGVFYFWKRDRFLSFALILYLATLSIVSNVVFPIGTNMSERFLFMPSLGIVLVVVRLMTRYIPNLKILGALTIVMVIGLGAKTIDRNRIWENDFTLFTNDVNENTRSAKLLNAAGGALTTNAASMQDSPQRTASLQKAIGYLEKAVEIHPTYRNAYLLMGNAYYYLRDYENAVAMFDKALAIDPEFKDALQNLPIVLRDGGRHMGQNQNNFVKAQQWLERSYSMNPDDYETCRLLGITYGIQGIHNKAIEFFQKAIALKPNIAANYATLGTAYRNAGQKDKAREAFNKALELDPNALQHLTN